MKESVIGTYANCILAQQVTECLRKAGIAFRQQDETQSPHSGMNGPMPGITIYVSAAEYEKAMALVASLGKEAPSPTGICCPHCGSDKVGPARKNRYETALLLLAIPLFILPFFYWYYAPRTDYRSVALNILSWMVFLSSFALVGICHLMECRYRCHYCGKSFWKGEKKKANNP